MSNPGFLTVERELRSNIESELNRLGIMYRLFSRIKDSNSINEKLSRKNYSKDGKLMQDIFGFRLITYFNDDVSLLFKTLKSKFDFDNEEYDEALTNVFSPLRKNLVCRLPKDLNYLVNEVKKVNSNYDIIDGTFEIQFRTTLSEGWHEVEHNMRYKCKSEWDEYAHESRMLNGIYASLEASDHTLKNLFDSLSYQNYKSKNWEAMLRNKFRLRFKHNSLNENIVEILNSKKHIPRVIFKLDRLLLLDKIAKSNLYINYTFDNIVLLCNYLYIQDDSLKLMTPRILIDDFENCFPKQITAISN